MTPRSLWALVALVACLGVARAGCPGADTTFTCADGTIITLSCGNATTAVDETSLRCAVEEIAPAHGAVYVSLEPGKTYALASELVVPSAATVEVVGNGAVLSGEASTTRLFNQTAHEDMSTLALHNLTLSHGQAVSAGAAIYCLGGSLVLAHVTVEHCVTTQSSTSAKLARGAVFFADVDDDRGLLSTSSQPTLTLEVSNSTFWNNTALATSGHPQGAALHVKCNRDVGDPVTTVTVTDTTFAENRSPQWYYTNMQDGGGALYTYANEAGMLELTMARCAFSNNYARTAGAAFVGRGTYASMHNTEFTNNTADNDGACSTGFGGGGAIHLMRWAQLELMAVEARGNSAVGPVSTSELCGQGGFLFADEWTTLLASDLVCEDNYADNHGGCLSGTSSVVDVFTSTFRNNTADFGTEVMMRTLSQFYAYSTSFIHPEYVSDSYLVHAYDDSEVVLDTSDLVGGQALATDYESIVRNSEMSGSVAFVTFSDNGMTLEGNASAGSVASCSDLADDLSLESKMKCSTDYCSDAATGTGIDCYCETKLYGTRDPTWEGCEDPALVSVLQDSFKVFRDKPDNVTQTFFFKNDGEEDLVWEAVVTGHDAGHAWGFVGPSSGNLSSCAVGSVTVQLPSFGVEAFQAHDLKLDLVSSAYAFTIPDDDTAAGTPINTTVELGVRYLVRAGVDPDHTVITGNDTSTATLNGSVVLPGDTRWVGRPVLDGTAGSAMLASVVPGDVAGLWIQSSTGAEKFTAFIQRGEDNDEDYKVCDVRFSASSDTYKIECDLDDFQAGEFVLVVEHGETRDRLAQAVANVTVGCPEGFVELATSPYPTCGCAQGERLDVGAVKCKPCPSNTYGRAEASIYQPNSCQRCASLITDSVTLTNGATSVDACVCNPLYYRRQWFDNESYAVNHYMLMGACDECPEGASCPGYGNVPETLIIQEGYWRAYNATTKIYECVGPPHGDVCAGTNSTPAGLGGRSPCIEGHWNVKCQSCNDDWFRDVDGTCTHCDELGWGVKVLSFLLGLLMLVMVFVVVVAGVVASRALARNDKAKQLEREAAAKAEHAKRTAGGQSAAGRKLSSAIGKVKMANNLGFAAALNTEMASSVIDADSALESQGLYDSIVSILGFVRRSLRKAQKQFKIILDELQLVSSVSFSLFPSIPGGPRTLFSMLTLLSFDLANLLPWECYLGKFDFHDRVVMDTVTPIVLVAVCLSFNRLSHFLEDVVDTSAVRKSKERSDRLIAWLLNHREQFRLLATFFLYLNYTKACSTVFQLFKCDTIEWATSTERLLAADYTIDCNTPTHQGMIAYGLIMVLVFPVGVPVFFFVLLWSFRDKMTLAEYRRDPQHADKDEDELLEVRLADKALCSFTFLFRNYNATFYWFESIECARKCAFCLMVTFFATGSSEQVLMSMLLYFAIFSCVANTNPYADPMDTYVSMVCYASTFLALAVGIVLIAEASLSSTEITILFFFSSMVPLALGLFCTFRDSFGSIEHLVGAMQKRMERKAKQKEIKQRGASRVAAEIKPCGGWVGDDIGADNPVEDPVDEGKSDSPAPARGRLAVNPFSRAIELKAQDEKSSLQAEKPAAPAAAEAPSSQPGGNHSNL